MPSVSTLHCPGCGAGLELPLIAPIKCKYCGGHLVVEGERVTHVAPQDVAAVSQTVQPDATLEHRTFARFELSSLQQSIAGAPDETFSGIELPNDAFALLSLRIVTSDGKPIGPPSMAALRALVTSLEEDGDPGLAANLALEAQSGSSFTDAMECAIVLFEPRRMTVTVYNAGCRDSVHWISTEEGRTIAPNARHPRLERKMLRESRDAFSNEAPIALASGDLMVLTSAACAGRGSKYGGALGQMIEVWNQHLGEDPLRVVTLAKNAFWEARVRSTVAAKEAPIGNVRMVAVRAVPQPLLAATATREALAEPLRTSRFEIALASRPLDFVELIRLHDERHALLWLSPAPGQPSLDPGAIAKAREAILAVLDRPQHGDNENPRLAGRKAYAALEATPKEVRLALMLLIDRHGAVKYFRAGFAYPIALGPRGTRGEGSQQAFDEGGEAYPGAGGRLFFPGALPSPERVITADELYKSWPGGRASRLHDALADHWKTKKTERAFGKISLAAASDLTLDSADPRTEAPLAGTALLTLLS